MDKISINMDMFHTGVVDSLETQLPISEYFRLIFFRDVNVRMIKLFNTRAYHTEYYLTSEQFRRLSVSFSTNYRSMTTFQRTIVLSASLRMTKSDGIIYLKGCHDATCKGIQLTQLSTIMWDKMKELMIVAQLATLNYR